MGPPHPPPQRLGDQRGRTSVPGSVSLRCLHGSPALPHAHSFIRSFGRVWGPPGCEHSPTTGGSGAPREGLSSLRRDLLEGASPRGPGPCGFRRAGLCRGLQEVAVGSEGGPPGGARRACWGRLLRQTSSCLAAQGHVLDTEEPAALDPLSPLPEVHPWLVTERSLSTSSAPIGPKAAPVLHHGGRHTPRLLALPQRGLTVTRLAPRGSPRPEGLPSPPHCWSHSPKSLLPAPEEFGLHDTAFGMLLLTLFSSW